MKCCEASYFAATSIWFALSSHTMQLATTTHQLDSEWEFPGSESWSRWKNGWYGSPFCRTRATQEGPDRLTSGKSCLECACWPVRRIVDGWWFGRLDVQVVGLGEKSTFLHVKTRASSEVTTSTQVPFQNSSIHTTHSCTYKNCLWDCTRIADVSASSCRYLNINISSPSFLALLF
jgi:hypothetical protein